MKSVEFASLDSCDVMELQVFHDNGRQEQRRFLVDTGFTGQSELILPVSDLIFMHYPISSAVVRGAVIGRFRRGTILCRIPDLDWTGEAICVFADSDPILRPAGVDGMVGLPFLRRFNAWGGRRDAAGKWQFTLHFGE